MQYSLNRALSTTLNFPCIASEHWLVESEHELPAVMTEIGNQPFHVLGGGSNVLCATKVLPRVVQLGIKGIQLIDSDDQAVYVEVGAGESWHGLVLHTLSQGWAGLENLALIPGWVGAAPVQNIGAYGLEVEQRIHSVRAWDCAQAQWVTLSRADCQFAYRDSVFKRHAGRYLITHVTFCLPKVWAPILSYQPLKQQFETVAAHQLSAQAVCDAVIDIRQSKLPDPAVLPNAGSFFKNPALDATSFKALHTRFPSMPHYPQRDGSFKLAAGWLIEQCGWKGYRAQTPFGTVGVHRDQALVLVHPGGAVGADLITLAQQIQTSVVKCFGVALEREVNVW